MAKTIFDVYRIKYKTQNYGIANATISSNNSLCGVEALLKKELNKMNVFGLEVLAIEKYSKSEIEKSGFKSDKEVFWNLGINNK